MVPADPAPGRIPAHYSSPLGGGTFLSPMGVQTFLSPILSFQYANGSPAIGTPPRQADRAVTSGEWVHPSQTRKSSHVGIVRVEFRLVLDCQGGEMGIGRQIAAATRPLEEIE